VIQCIAFTHKWRLENQIGFDAKVVSSKIFYGLPPCFCGETFVDMKPKYCVIVGLKPNGYSTSWMMLSKEL